MSETLRYGRSTSVNATSLVHPTSSPRLHGGARGAEPALIFPAKEVSWARSGPSNTRGALTVKTNGRLRVYTVVSGSE